MCVYMCTSMCIRVYAFIYILSILIYMYACVCVCVYTYIWVYVCGGNLALLPSYGSLGRVRIHQWLNVFWGNENSVEHHNPVKELLCGDQNSVSTISPCLEMIRTTVIESGLRRGLIQAYFLKCKCLWNTHEGTERGATLKIIWRTLLQISHFQNYRPSP